MIIQTHRIRKLRIHADIIAAASRPEALEVFGDLLRPAVRGEQVQQEAHATPRDRRALLESEQFLDAGRENRRATGLVGETDLGSAGDGVCRLLEHRQRRE